MNICHVFTKGSLPRDLWTKKEGTFYYFTAQNSPWLGGNTRGSTESQTTADIWNSSRTRKDIVSKIYDRFNWFSAAADEPLCTTEEDIMQIHVRTDKAEVVQRLDIKLAFMFLSWEHHNATLRKRSLGHETLTPPLSPPPPDVTVSYSLRHVKLGRSCGLTKSYLRTLNLGN